MASVKGKNILITQSAMRVIAGSEIVALELAEELQNMGANVKIFTWEYGAPIRKFVEKKNIKVTCNEYDPFFKAWGKFYSKEFIDHGELMDVAWTTDGSGII